MNQSKQITKIKYKIVFFREGKVSHRKFQKMSFVGFLLLTGLVVEMGVEDVWGHGMMLYPPNRSSLWRFDPHAPVNYNDVENFCGGFGVSAFFP